MLMLKIGINLASNFTDGEKPEEGKDYVKSVCPLLDWAIHMIQWSLQWVAKG